MVFSGYCTVSIQHQVADRSPPHPTQSGRYHVGRRRLLSVDDTTPRLGGWPAQGWGSQEKSHRVMRIAPGLAPTERPWRCLAPSSERAQEAAVSRLAMNCYDKTSPRAVDLSSSPSLPRPNLPTEREAVSRRGAPSVRLLAWDSPSD
jgi:hypothetical protein